MQEQTYEKYSFVSCFWCSFVVLPSLVAPPFMSIRVPRDRGYSTAAIKNRLDTVWKNRAHQKTERERERRIK